MLLLAGAARGEDAAALMARVPGLALDGPVAPLVAPVALGGAGWGPFHRLCVARSLLLPDGRETPEASPFCLAVESAHERDDAWLLRLRTQPPLPGRGVVVAARRDAAGRVDGVEFEVPEGEAPPPPAFLERLRRLYRAAIGAHGVPRRTVAPDKAFVIALPLGGVDASIAVEREGFVCQPEGQARLRGRAVLVAACTARAAGRIGPGRAMEVTLAGRFAIDLPTGPVRRHRYASFMVTQADPQGARGPVERRGESRQDLE